MRGLSLSFESSDVALDVRRFVAREAVSGLFELSIWGFSERPDLDADNLAGGGARFEAHGEDAGGAAGRTRAWAGICNRFELHQVEETGVSLYSVVIVPHLWRLTQTRRYRTFQHATVPEIIDAVLEPWTIEREWRIDAARYDRLEYRVQYGESDYAFMSRMLEDAGIGFTVHAGPRGSVVRFCDRLHDATARAAAIRFVHESNLRTDAEHVTKVRFVQEARARAATLIDYDFRRPSFAHVATHAAETEPVGGELCLYQPGSFVAEIGSDGATPVADELGAARATSAVGQKRAEVMLESVRAGRRSVHLTTNVIDLAPGDVFAVAGHPHPALDEANKLLAIEVAVDGSHDRPWSIEVQAVFASEPFRPPQKTPKPRMHGVDVAVVVGKSDEIHVDEFGRVRLRFNWDGGDEGSCWARVSQGWAGVASGMAAHPRAGEEVVVSYPGGDVDLPLVTGRLFNAVNMPAYDLPKHKDRSYWRSRSTPRASGYNEIALDDAAGNELVSMRAERDLRVLVRRDEGVSVERNRTVRVGADERQTIEGGRSVVVHASDSLTVEVDRRERVKGNVSRGVSGDAATAISGNEAVRVGGVRRTLLEGDSHRHVAGEHREKVDGKWSLTAGADVHGKVGGAVALHGAHEIHLTAGGALVIDSAQDLTIKGPGGFIRIDAMGVTIKGTKVLINSGGEPGNAAEASPDEPEDPEVTQEADHQDDAAVEE